MELQQTFVDESGIPFSFVTVLYEGFIQGDPATAEVAATWDGELGVSGAYPVLVDPTGEDILKAVPVWTGSIPNKVVLSPELEILHYYFGHANDEEEAFPVITKHYAGE